MSRRSKKPPQKKATGNAGGDFHAVAHGVHGKHGSGHWEIAVICALLVMMVFLAFGRTVRHGFVNFDDNLYVYENAMVARGLTMEGLEWAFTHSHSANWHPLTTISHMLDSQFYGLWAGGHHLTNVMLHAVAAVLLFFMLREMTGALWRCALVAAVFAIHPLRVESVAWVAERKDVLSGIFFMLTLRAYARYARRPGSKGLYAMVCIWLALGLMSKPMLVTVPFVLLLLDYWPLGRLQQKSQLPRLAWEKLPLFALSAASCLVTAIVQKQAIQPVGNYPFSQRLGNALVTCCIYLEKTIYPSGLSAFHPILKNGWPAWQVIGAAGLLIMLTAGAWMLRRKQPYLIAGWLWYLGMLVPVIGLLQVGGQAYADRYTYLPQIGLCFAGVWAVADLTRGWRYRNVAGAVAAVGLCMLLAAAYHQTSYWRDSETLWRRSLELTEENYLAHNNLGSALFQQGRVGEAVVHYREALQINPGYAEARNNLGSALFQQGQAVAAMDEYREALRIHPDYAQARYNLGNALLRQGQTEQAIAEYREALKIDPDYWEAHSNLGNVLFQQGHAGEAIAEYRRGLQINPADSQAHDNLGSALLWDGRTDEAISEYREALRIDPADAEANYNLGNALFQHGQLQEAITSMHKALELKPANTDIENTLAWMLATVSQPSLRDGPAAVQLATRAAQSTGGGDPGILRTLAAAYAETGEFSKAAETAQNALQLAEARSNATLAASLRREIKLYEAGHRFQETP